MILDTTKTELMKIQLPNGAFKNGYVILTTVKVDNDKDAKELNQLFKQGVEISCVINNYVFVKQFQESKVSL